MLLKLGRALRLRKYLIVERHNYIREPALYLLILRVGDVADILQLIALLVSRVLFDLILPFPLLRVVGLVLRLDLREALRAYRRRIIE
jgi:hypothetical protein